jgi:hypothetical protein
MPPAPVFSNRRQNGLVSDDLDLWTMPLSELIPTDVIDGFVEARVREHQHHEYRRGLDVKPRNRFVETVAAMANAGGTGLILIGVEEDGHDDHPVSAWHLKAPLRPQALESQCRVLQPYVPIEVGSAIRPSGGAVTVARVPDFPSRPVFVPERGILVRSGQANLPATLDQLRAWFGAKQPAAPVSISDQGFSGYFIGASTTGRSLSLGLTRGRDWDRLNWDEGTDEALEAAVRGCYRDLPVVTIGQDIINFAANLGEGKYENFLRCDSRAAVLRHWQDPLDSRPDPESRTRMDSALDVEDLAREVVRFWRFARTAVVTVASGYVGPFTLWCKVGGVPGGLSFPQRPRGLERSPFGGTDYWTTLRPELPGAMSDAEVATAILAPLARAFGYRTARGPIEERHPEPSWVRAERYSTSLAPRFGMVTGFRSRRWPLIDRLRPVSTYTGSAF